MESRVVRIYGEGSGIVGDLFGIVAIIFGAFALMAILSFTLQKQEITGTESNELTWMEKAALADSAKQNDKLVEPKPVEGKATTVDQGSSADFESKAIPSPKITSDSPTALNLSGSNNQDPSSVDGNSPEGILKQLQGKWQAVALEHSGVAFTSANVAKHNKVMTITGDKFRVSYNQHWLPNPMTPGLEEGRIISFNLTSTPQQIEILLSEPLYLKGIFELRGDRLRHCFRKCPLNDGNCTSPEDFTTQAGEVVFFDEYVRVAEDTTEPSLISSTTKSNLSQEDVMDSLQGQWKCIATEEIGKVLDEATVTSQNRRIDIKGNNLRMTRLKDGSRATYVGKFEVDSSNQSFDFVGKVQDGDGKLIEWVGIFDLEGDTLRLCYRYKNNDQLVRPTVFETDTSKPNVSVFYTYKKVGASAGEAKTRGKTNTFEDAIGKVEPAWRFFDIHNKGVEPDQAFIVSQDGRLVCLGKMGGYCLATLKPLSKYQFKIEFLIPPQGLESGHYIAVASSKPNPKGKDFYTQYPFGIEIKLSPDVIGELVLPPKDFKVELPLGQLRDDRKIVAIRKPDLKTGDWNTLEVTCDEHKNVTVKINGTTVNAIAKAERTEGHIVIMPHRSEIQFRSPILIIDDVKKPLPFTSITTK